MLILELVINELAMEKLEARGISPVEVEQVLGNDPVVGDNPEPRVPGSKLAIGPTAAARFLAVVLQPDEGSATRWHLMTAWESSARQVAAFHRGR